MADVKHKDRQNRLAAALRENLKRRKAQLRDRAVRPPADAPDAPDDATADGTAAEPDGGEKSA